jgi:hypothetical protein
MDNTEKKEGVTILLKEIEKVIVKAIDNGKVEEYTPLDLVYLAVQEIAQVAAEMQMMDEVFDKDDTNGKGKA